MARITDTREVPDFAFVVVQGVGDVILEQVAGEPGAAQRVVIEADEAVMPLLKVEVRDGRLLLGLDIRWYQIDYWRTWTFTPDKRIQYRVTSRQFDGVSIQGAGSFTASRLRADNCRLQTSGAGRIRVEEIECASLKTSISGSGDVDLAGVAPRHEIRISGSGDVKAAGLDTQVATVSISGAGNATLMVSRQLDVQISGVGNVRYAGQPAVTQHITGAGRVSLQA